MAKLAGMAYHGGRHTPEEWEKITGVNPRLHPEIRISSDGTCWWTDKARAIYAGTCRNTRACYHALGIG